LSDNKYYTLENDIHRWSFRIGIHSVVVSHFLYDVIISESCYTLKDSRILYKQLVKNGFTLENSV
jgi:hypothetical protein